MIAFTRLASTIGEPTSAPSLAPLAAPIDREHLSRMTLGERSLEREVLGAIRPPGRYAACAHEQVGARGRGRGSAYAQRVGAWDRRVAVANAAEAVELAAARPAAAFKAALATIGAAIDETKVAIADLLRSN